jgi:2-dehydropantoate 2-reductase
MTDRRWHVLGAGAMGRLFAQRLAGSGCDITLLSRCDTTERDTEMLRVVRNGRERSQQAACSAKSANGPIDRLLVLTKAQSVDTAIAEVALRLHCGSVVLILANGRGFAPRLPAGAALARGTTTEGAYRREDGAVIHAGEGVTVIGLPGVGGGPPGWFQDSWGRLPRCEWRSDIETLLWRKLAINCVINPLTALHRCRNGALSDPPLRREAEALLAEVTSACRALGQSAAACGLEEELWRVVEATAVNRSSMLQDVLAGRPTEIAAISGFLLRQAEKRAIALPRTRQLYESLAAPAASTRD